MITSTAKKYSVYRTNCRVCGKPTNLYFNITSKKTGFTLLIKACSQEHAEKLLNK